MRGPSLLKLPWSSPFVFIFGFLSCLIATNMWLHTEPMHLLTAPWPLRTARTGGRKHCHDSVDKTKHGNNVSTLEQANHRIRILCLVMTHPGHHLNQAKHTHQTWTRRCSRVLFVTNSEPRPSDPEYKKKVCHTLAAMPFLEENLQNVLDIYCKSYNETNVINDDDFATQSKLERRETTDSVSGFDNGFPDVSMVQEWRYMFNPRFPILEVKEAAVDRSGLWAKTIHGFQHAHDNLLNEYEWFLKTDDDTYVIMENLRLLLQTYDSADPLYFGCNFRENNDTADYMSGGGGYVLSREALVRFVRTLKEDDNMILSTDAEDVMMGEALKRTGVVAEDSRDNEGRPRFFPLSAASMASTDDKDKPFWYWHLTGYNHNSGPGCCSPSTISFHYMSVNDMYVMEMLLYHITVHGR